MESLSDQLHDTLLLSNNVELTDEDNRVKNVEHSYSDGDTKGGDHDGEKIQNEVTVTELSDSPSPNVDSSPAPLDSNAQIPNYESQLSEATSSSELSKLNQLDIISPNTHYDSLDLANNRIEAARSHQSQHSSEELASPPRPLSCADGLTSQEYEQFVLSVLNVNICKNEKDRLVVEWIEQQLANFIADDRVGYKRFEEMTSYHRMLVHRVAEYYRLYHHVDQSGKCVVVSKQTTTINSPAVLGHGSASSSLNSSQNLTSVGSPAGSGKTNALFSAVSSANCDINSGHGTNQTRVSNQQPSPGGALTGTGKSPNMSSSSPRTSSNSSTGINDSQITSGPLNGTLSNPGGGSNMKSSGSNMVQQQSTGQRFPHGDRGHKSNNSGSSVAGEYGVIASTGERGGGNQSQYTNYGGLKKKSVFSNVNKRIPTYTDQAAFGGPRKTFGGYHSQASQQQGTGRYGANFGDTSGMRPRNPNSSAFRSAKPAAGLYDSVNSVPSINNNRMRYPNKGSVHGNQNNHNFSAGAGSNAQPGVAYMPGGAVSVSSNAPYGQMLPTSAFPFPNIIAKPDGSITAASANAAAQLHGYSLGAEEINASLPAGQINIAPSGFHPGAAVAFTEPAAIPFNWVYAPHNAASAAAAAALQMHAAAGVPNLAAVSGASNNYVTAATTAGGPSNGGFYPANMVNPAAAGGPTNVPLGISMQMQPVQQNMGNNSAATSSGSNSAKLLSQQQHVQPNINSNGSAISSEVKKGEASSTMFIPQGSSATSSSSAGIAGTGAGDSLSNGTVAGTGSQSSMNSGSCNGSARVAAEDYFLRQQNKFLTQQQQQAAGPNTAASSTCASPNSDVPEKDATKSSGKELPSQADVDVESGATGASVEEANQGALQNGESQPIIAGQNIEKDANLNNSSNEFPELQSSSNNKLASNIKEQQETSSVNINGSVSDTSATQTPEKVVASSNMHPSGAPVYSVVAGTNGYPMEQIGVPLTNLPNAWNATTNANAQHLMQIPNFNMSSIYQQQLINAAASKNHLAAMNMVALNHGSGSHQGLNTGAAVLQNPSTAHPNMNCNQMNGTAAFSVNNASSYCGMPISGPIYQTGSANVPRGGAGLASSGGAQGPLMFQVAASGMEQQQHGMSNMAMASQPTANQSAATIPSNQQCPSIIPFINHNQVTGAVAAYPSEQIASVMQPYLKHHLQYQQASSSLTGSTQGLQNGPAVNGGPVTAATAPFMQQMSSMNPPQTTPLAQTAAPPSNSYTSPNAIPQTMMQQQPPSSSGASGGTGQQHIASAASFNTFHNANAAALARMNLQQTTAPQQQVAAAAASAAQQHQPARMAAIPLYQTPPQMYAAAAAASALYGPAAYTYGMLVSRMPQPHNSVFTTNAMVPAGIYPNGAAGTVNAGATMGSGTGSGSPYAMQSTRNNVKGQLRNNAVHGAKSPKIKNSDLEVSSKLGTSNVSSTQLKGQ